MTINKNANFLSALSLSLLFNASVAWANAGAITYMDAGSGQVTFATNAAKTAAVPSCVTQDNLDKWSLSLADESGRAMYALLVTALAANQSVSVESAGDCAAKQGYERPARVMLTPAVASQSAEQPSTLGAIGIYSDGGETFIGKLIEIKDDGSWLYIDKEGGFSPKTIGLPNATQFQGSNVGNYLYFKNSDCSDALPATKVTIELNKYVFNLFYDNGKLFRATDNSNQASQYPYELTPTGQCRAWNSGGNVRRLNLASYSVCGERACILK